MRNNLFRILKDLSSPFAIIILQFTNCFRLHIFTVLIVLLYFHFLTYFNNVQKSYILILMTINFKFVSLSVSTKFMCSKRLINSDNAFSNAEIRFVFDGVGCGIIVKMATIIVSGKTMKMLQT